MAPISAQAEEGFSYSRGIGLDAFAGSSSEISQKALGSAWLNLEGRYDWDEDTGVSLNLDTMLGFNRPDEDYNNGKWGKELYASADSRYGRLMLGETWSAANQLGIAAPNAGDSEIGEYFYTNPNHERKGREVSFKTLNSTAINTDGVAPKITYFTPEFYGTTAGFSYVPDINNRRGLTDQYLRYDNRQGYVAAIANAFDAPCGIEVGTSLSYGIFRETDRDAAIGLSLSRGGWALSGAYRKTDVAGKRNPIAAGLADGYREGDAWDVGLGYEIGPFETSLSYFESRSKLSQDSDRMLVFANQYKVNKYAKIYLAAALFESEGGAVMAGVGLGYD